MYITASKLTNLPILSLQTGETIAWTRRPVLEVTQLAAVAFTCETTDHPASRVLLARDIRQLAPDCLIIDSEHDLSEPDDLVRLQHALRLNYSPIGKEVVSEIGRRLGRVEDYNFNLDTLRVQQLNVRQSLIKAWLGDNLVIDRSQIIEITPHRISVRDATIDVPVIQPSTLPQGRS